MIVKHALKVSALLLVVLATASLSRVNVVADDKPAVSADLKKLQGTWISETGADSQWIFEDDNLKATVNGQFYQCRVTLDDKAKPLAEINIKIIGGAADALGKLSKGIYKFDGERIMLCIGVPGEDARPTEFETEDGKCYAFELKKKS